MALPDSHTELARYKLILDQLNSRPRDYNMYKLYKCSGCDMYTYDTDFNRVCEVCEPYCNECIEKIYPIKFSDYQYIQSQEGGDGSYVRVGAKRGCILHNFLTVCENCDLFCGGWYSDGIHNYCDEYCAQEANKK